MALQGTLDTFSLPDVLRLLATTGKTGCLHVDGDRGRGKVWIDDGAVVAATADRALGEPTVDEVVFEMLRFGRGSFSFAVDEAAPPGSEPVDIEGTLRRASQLLDEWRELEAIVPSLSHRVAMAPELTVEQVTVDADRWKALVAIASGRSVGELAEKLGIGELGISRTVSDLVELGVAVVEPPAPTRSSNGASSRRNVTDIGSRTGDTPRRSHRSEPRRDPLPSDGSPQVNWAQTADPIGPPDTGNGGGGVARPASSTRLASRNSAAALPQANEAPALAPASRLMAAQAGSGPAVSAATAVGVVTPAAGIPSIEPAPRSRRQTGTNRAARARRNAPSSGQTPLTPARGGSTLPVPPLNERNLAAMPDPVGEPAPGPIFPSALDTGPIFPPSLETSPPSGLMLPSSLDTGRLGPSPLPTQTGQIPAVASTALPPDLSWAAEDNEAPIGPPPGPRGPSAPPPAPAPAPARVLAPPPSRSPMPARHDGDPAPHVVAMSDPARAAVEATVGRSGGGPGGSLAGLPQAQAMGRVQLVRYLSSVRG